MTETARYYANSPLFMMESRNYLSHLAQQGENDRASELEGLLDKGFKLKVAWSIVNDQGFAWTLRATDETFWGPTIYPRWKAERQKLEAMTARFSLVRFGLSGAEHRPLTFLTYGFLHYSTLHWWIALLSLLVAGSLGERQLGGLALLVSTTGGILAGAIVIAVLDSHSGTPHAGSEAATGAILGAHLMLSPRQRYRLTIRGGRTASIPLWSVPVLWMMLVLLMAATEPRLALTPWAAIAGIAFGALLIRPLRTSLTSVPETPPEDETALRAGLHTALKQLSAFDFVAAENSLRALAQQFPHRSELIERLVTINAFCQGPASVRVSAPEALQGLKDSPRNIYAAWRVYRLYRLDKGAPPLPADLHETLLEQADSHHLAHFVRALTQETGPRQKSAPITGKSDSII